MTRFRFSQLLRTDSDETLLRAYAAGDAGAFEQLYLRHKDGLYNFVLRSLTLHAVAEEIVQDVWMAVIDRAAQFEPGDATFRTWLYRIGRNKVADFYRRKVNQPTEELDTHDEQFAARQPDAEKQMLVEQLLNALSELPEDQRVTFVLQQEGFSHKEIAEITGVGSETVKSRLRYAKSSTRRRMELKA